MLHTELTRLLPGVILKAEDDAPASSLLHNALNRNLLLFVARNSRAVVTGSMAGPSRLQIIRVLPTWTHRLQLLQRARHKVARTRRIAVGVEERMDIRRHDVRHGAERLRIRLQRLQRLRHGDRALVAALLRRQRAAHFANEVGEIGGGAVTLEDGLVADDHHLDALPAPAAVVLAPRHEFLDLRPCAGDAAVPDVDAGDEVEPRGGAGGADVL